MSLSHIRVGQGPPVLLIQGVGAIGETWRPQLTGLQQQFQMVAFDNPGIGTSPPLESLSIQGMADAARQLMDDLGWDRAHVVGHSMGGVIAQQLALDAPERVMSLGLLCTFVRGRDGAVPSLPMMWLGLRTRVGTPAMRRRAFVEMVVARSQLASIDRDAFAAKLEPLFGRDLADSPAVLMDQVRALGDSDLSDRLGELSDIETLVLSGAEDLVAPPEQGRALAEAIPGATYVELDEAGHALPIRRAAAVNAVLREHWTVDVR